MELAFYIAGAVAVISTILMLTRLNVVHALLYLIVSLLGVAVVFYTLGAPFVAALEVIIYAGAIMVLFVFVVMMLNVAEHAMEVEYEWLRPRNWFGPSVLTLILLGEVTYCIVSSNTHAFTNTVSPKQVGVALYGTYWIGVELASLLLMAGLVGAFHLGRHTVVKEETKHAADTDAARPDSSGDLVGAGSSRTDHSA